MATGKKLSEARRCFAVLAIFFIILSLTGSHLPWLTISENGHEHDWYFAENESGGTINTATYNVDVYLNLLSVESCQTFISGTLPYSDQDLKGRIMCSELSYSETPLDSHDWDVYKDSCESAGTVSFCLLVTAMCIFTCILLFSTFKNWQRKCCPGLYESQHAKTKWILPTLGFLSPLLGIVTLLMYFSQCIQGVEGSAHEVARSTSGHTGYWLALVGVICMTMWWILHTIWFCRKGVVKFDNNDVAQPALENSTQRNERQPIADYSDDDASPKVEMAKKKKSKGDDAGNAYD